MRDWAGIANQAETHMRLIIGNRTYSSWSLRAWLAAKQSGLGFETVVVPMFGPDWDAERRANPDLAPSGGRVPVLWDGDAVAWDSLAIMEVLADRLGRDRYWPRDAVARALARSMVAEMHAGFAGLRGACPLNLRRRVAGFVPDDAVRGDLVRLLGLWAEARARFGDGGPFLFGGFGAADIAFAPVCGRIVTYGLAVPGFAETYVAAIMEHPWMREYVEAAEREAWVIDRFEIASR